jgi:hypothetical protein
MDRVTVLENGMLTGREKEDVTDNGKKYVMRNFIICTLHLILLT